MNLTTLSAAVVASASVLAVTAAASAGPDSPGRASGDLTVLRFIDRVDPGSNVDLDLGDAGLSVGDQQVFTDRLMRAGKRVGTATGAATITGLTDSTITGQVVSTALLKRGSLTLQFAFIEVFADGPAPVSLAAVTGGTGAYAGATGQCRSVLLDDGDDRAVTCRIRVMR